jgi:hypothetical protein
MMRGDEDGWEHLLHPLSLSPPRVGAGDEVVVGKRRALVQRVSRKRLHVNLHDGSAVVVGRDAVSLLRTAAEIRRDADLSEVNKKKHAPALPRSARCENLLVRPIDTVDAATSPISPLGSWKRTGRGKWTLCAITPKRPKPCPPCLSSDELGRFLESLDPTPTP